MRGVEFSKNQKGNPLMKVEAAGGWIARDRKFVLEKITTQKLM